MTGELRVLLCTTFKDGFLIRSEQSGDAVMVELAHSAILVALSTTVVGAQSESSSALLASFVLSWGLSYKTTFNKELWISNFPLYST
jgi:hypothetical protein